MNETGSISFSGSFRFKNYLRAVIGFTGGLLPYRTGRKKLYINLKNKGGLGGPNRFLRNFMEVLREKEIRVSNYSLRGCQAALVFSASWGDSFTWLSRRLGVRSVLRVDGFYVPEVYGAKGGRPMTEYQKWVNQRLKADLARFDHVIYQSAFAKEQTDLYLYARDHEYSIIYNGVHTEFFKPGASFDREGWPTIIVLGKHYPEQLALALDVFKQVRSTQEARLLIVGPMRNGTDQDVIKYVREYLGDDPIGDDIRYLGTVPYEKLPETLTRADVFLHVKVGDWCPNAVIEALSCGLPVVCPTWGGTRELIGDAGLAVGSYSWAIDDGLYEEMAEAVLEIFANLDTFTVRARRIAVEKFDIRKVAGRYLKVLGFGGLIRDA